MAYFLVSALVYLRKEKRREAKEKREKKKEILEYMFTQAIIFNTVSY